MKKLLLLPILLLILLFVGSLWFLRSRLQDDTVPVVKNWQADEKVMFIFPHPDDEITCAGTLKLLDSLGIKTILITLTQGEAGATNGLVDESDPVQKKVNLGQLRREELLAVGEVLGIDHLEVFDFPDSGIQETSADLLKQLIQAKIDYYQPSIVVTYDDKIGFYGHPDHRLVAGYIKDIFLENRDRAGFPVKKLYQVTLPKPMIETALKISESFRSNYPTLAENGLPSPTVSVKITPFGNYKREAMLLHRSQRPTFDEMQPYFDKVPPFIFFRIFDKEYFAEVK